MKSSFLRLAAGLAACALAVPAFADDAKDARDVLLRCQQAQLAAPVCRMTVNTKVADTGKASVVTVETVSPNQMHVRQERDGKVMMEMFTDGIKTMVRRGPDGPIVEAPRQVGAMIANLRLSVSLQAMTESAKDVKVVGHEVINGQAATIYTFTTNAMGIQANSKLWISDKDALPLKAEEDSVGTLNVGLDVGDPKAHRHSEVTFDYDPSITVALPAAA